MHTKLLPMLRCPVDGGPLLLEGSYAAWVETGALVNPRSGARYPIRSGIPHLYVDDAIWAPKAREARGWVQLFRDTDGYGRDDGDTTWPYYDEQPWIDIARQFDITLEIIDPQPHAWVLDLGAGRGWAAKQFALHGCQAVAVDIVDDDQIGLGRTRALMDQAGIRFDACLADGERLPFAAESFDIVFCAATLHHATDLIALLRNAARVLRPGGRLAAINEPCIHDTADVAEVLRSPEVARELSYGINETRPRLDDYRRALRASGLREQALFPWLTYRMNLRDMASWSSELQILAPDQLRRPPPSGLAMRLWQRLFGAPGVTEDGRRRLWDDYLIRERGAAIIVIATKPEKSAARKGPPRRDDTQQS